MAHIFYTPDKEKAIAMAKSQNGNLSCLVPIKVDAIIGKTPEDFDFFVMELIFGEKFVYSETNHRILGYYDDIKYLASSVDEKGNIILSVEGEIHPECCK